MCLWNWTQLIHWWRFLKALIVLHVASPHNAAAYCFNATSKLFCISFTFSLSAGMVPSLFLLTAIEISPTVLKWQPPEKQRKEMKRGEGGGQKWQKQTVWKKGRICSSGSNGQVQKECSCPERGCGHHGNWDEGLCQNDNCSLLNRHLSLSLSQRKLYIVMNISFSYFWKREVCHLYFRCSAY